MRVINLLANSLGPKGMGALSSYQKYLFLILWVVCSFRGSSLFAQPDDLVRRAKESVARKNASELLDSLGDAGSEEFDLVVSKSFLPGTSSPTLMRAIAGDLRVRRLIFLLGKKKKSQAAAIVSKQYKKEFKKFKRKGYEKGSQSTQWQRCCFS